MKNFTKSTILFVSFVLLIVSCKDSTLEDLEPFIGKKCLEKTYEEYEKGQFMYRKINEYDDFDKLSKQTIISQNSTFITLYEYDKNNNLIKLSNEKGEVIGKYEYDSNNRIIKIESLRGANIENYEYYPNGQRRKITYFSLNVITKIREFDENGFPSKLYDTESYFLGDGITQNVVLKINKEIETISKYDSKGNLLFEYTTHNKSFTSSREYEYDANNRIVKSTVKDLRGSVTSNCTYQLDSKNRVISKKTDNLSEIKYEYNNDDLVSKIISFIQNQLHATTINEYNSAKRLIRTFELDPMGNIGYKNERTYYSDNSLKTSQTYYSKNGRGTELYKFNDSEFSPCGNIIKSINLSSDGSEERRIVATYLYR